MNQPSPLQTHNKTFARTTELTSKHVLTMTPSNTLSQIQNKFIFYQTNSEKTKDWKKLYKRPMGHIAFLRKQFKSIYTYDYIITFIKRIKKTINNFMRMYWFFIWTNLNPLDPRMLCAKFGWNWHSGSGEEDFLISSMYFCYFKIISPWKRVGPFIWTLNPLHPMMLCAKFGWNWHSGSGEGDF